MTAALRSCTRFKRSGDACENLTDYADRWCRECEGYRRSSRDVAPESEPVYVYAKKRDLDAAPQRRPEGLDEAPDTSTVRITQKAVDSFRFQHGGSEEEARVELAIMVEDFSLQSIGKETGGGFLGLSREGFSIVLSPGRDALVSYRTVHRERTWSQVKAGVRSRFRGTAKPPPRIEPGSALVLETPQELLTVLREKPPVVTTSAYVSAGRALGIGKSLSEDEAARVQALFDADLAANAPVTHDGRAFSIAGRELSWLVSTDGQAVIGAKRAEATDSAAEPESA